jgi:hypothetical protein
MRASTPSRKSNPALRRPRWLKAAGGGPLAALACLFALGGCGGPEAEFRPPPQVGPSVAERVKVLNADVLVVDGQHVRLAEAYAPQPIPDARCWAEALASKQATQEVRSLVHDAKEIHTAPTGRRDEYNRFVSHVTLDGADLSRTLQDAGLAAATPQGRFEWCNPISKGDAGAPALKALMDFSR